MASAEFTLDDFQFEGRCFSMEVGYEYEWENDGIGSYEYWGAKGNDKGNTYAEVQSHGIGDLVEHLPDGTEVAIPESDPLFKKVESAIEDRVIKHSESREPDCEPEYDCERDRDEGRYDCD